MCKHVLGTSKKHVLTGINHWQYYIYTWGCGGMDRGASFNPPLPVKTGGKRQGKTIYPSSHTHICMHTFPTHVMPTCNAHHAHTCSRSERSELRTTS
jgi:hypothetical protein